MDKNYNVILLPTFCLAVILISFLPDLPSPRIYALVSAGLFLFLCMGIKTTPILGALFFAWVWAVGWGIYQTNRSLPPEWEGQDLLVEGYIQDIPVEDEVRARFTYKLTQIIDAPHSEASVPVIRKIAVSWYDRPEEAKLRPGQVWRLKLRLRRPYSFMNPGGFDYEGWMMRQKISAIGYVRGEYELLHTRRSSWLSQARWRIFNHIRESDIQAKGFIAGLMLGERSLISRQENLILRRSGIAHLMAISGLHLSMVGGASFLLCLAILSFISGYIRRINSPLPLAASIALVFIWIYAFWTGLSLPTQRAAIMFSFFLGAIIRKRFFRLWTVYFLAMAAVLIIDPLAGIGGGFYLSFGAVALVLLSVKYLIPHIKPEWLRRDGTKPLSYTFDLVIIQLVLSLGLVPLGLIFFNEFSLIGIVINLIAIPLTSFIIMPWILIANLGLVVAPYSYSDLLLQPLGSFIAWFYSGLEFINQQYYGILTLPSPEIFAIGLAIIAIIILIWGIRPYNYLLALALFLPSIFPQQTNINTGEAKINFLDVGQGLAVHVQTSNHNLIYDTGASFSSGNNMGELVIVPYLKSQGIREIDSLIISHEDKDHSGGMLGILKAIKVGELRLNFDEDLLDSSEIIKPRRVDTCYEGTKWKWDGISFSIIHPAIEAKYKNRNDYSCVLLIEAEDNSVLLAGDITAKIERKLALNKQVEILQVPHHGSKSSSSVKFISSIAPQNAVFSAGYRNPFRHPAREIVARYEEQGSANWITWREGRLSFQISRDGLKHLDSYRKTHKRYWHFNDQE